MEAQQLEKLKYPVGKFSRPEAINKSLIESWIDDIANFPEQVAMLVSTLSMHELKWIYRPGGWSIKQVVHHCADSHMNAYIRFKLALTEENPTIKPYVEARWAELHDANDADLEDSLGILFGLHRRWVKMLKKLNIKDLKRSYIHPEHNKTFSLDETIGSYAWHCRHHLAHIQQAIVHRGDF